MKLPVISTAIGAEGLDYKDEESILIANAPEAFATSVVRLLEEKELQNTLAKNGRTLATQHYDWRSVSKQLEHAYESIAP